MVDVGSRFMLQRVTQGDADTPKPHGGASMHRPGEPYHLHPPPILPRTRLPSTTLACAGAASSGNPSHRTSTTKRHLASARHGTDMLSPASNRLAFTCFHPMRCRCQGACAQVPLHLMWPSKHVQVPRFHLRLGLPKGCRKRLRQRWPTALPDS